MRWVALKMLTGDRTKFLGIVLGITFSAFLITQQGSIFCGLMCRTAAQVTDIQGADLWVMEPNVRFIDDIKPLQENELQRVRGIEGVEWAVPLYKGMARAKLNQMNRQGEPETIVEQVILLGLDDASMVGAPRTLHVGNLADLRRPDSVIVDKIGLRKLFPGQGGEQGIDLERFLYRELEMNDRRAVIVGVCESTRTFQSSAVCYTTYSRAKQYVPRERKTLSYILVKTDADRDPREVAKTIERETGLGAKTGKEFFWMTVNYYLRYTGIPINFGIAVALGFLVGTAISGLLFYTFTQENIRQFGSLKAMGATNLQIVRIVGLQAAVVGVLGYGIGIGLAAMFGLAQVRNNTELAFFTPWQLPLITGALVVAICMLSSLLSIIKVVLLEPAIVFRG